VDNIDNIELGFLDNGVYIIKDWEIVDRKYYHDEEQDKYNLDEMLQVIDARQPFSEQLGEILTSIEVPTNEVKVGDTVYVEKYSDRYAKHTIVGFGKDIMIDGESVLNIPFTDEYDEYNINSYIRTKTIRIKKERNRN
jgi:hypothetical protein